MLIRFCKTFDIKYRIFRLANVLGEGDNKVSRKKNALQYMIKCIAQNEEIFLYDSGNVVRDYIYVDDACEAIHTLVRNAEYDQIINIGNGIPYVLKDIITQAAEIAQSSSKVNIIKPSYFHEIVQVKDSYLDVTKLKSYKFKSKYDMEEIIKKLILYYK
jgi:nucleoside-diphosphate-sugar epimerase